MHERLDVPLDAEVEAFALDRLDDPVVRPRHGPQPATELRRLLGAAEVAVNSRHHQAMRAAELAPGLAATAWSPDGVVEAFERPGEGWLVAVQWHPERVAEVGPACRHLAEALVERAARASRRTAGRSV